MFENIPKPILYVGGAGAILFFFLAFRRSGGESASPLGLTFASMQLASASNIDALAITAPRDVALAAEYTARTQLAEQYNTERLTSSLAYFASKNANKTTISLADMAHKENLRELGYDFRLTKRALFNERAKQDQLFTLAKEQARFDFDLSKFGLVTERQFMPQSFTLSLRELARQENADRQSYELAARRLDILETQALLGGGGIPGAIGQGSSALFGENEGGFVGGVTDAISSIGGLFGLF